MMLMIMAINHEYDRNSDDEDKSRKFVPILRMRVFMLCPDSINQYLHNCSHKGTNRLFIYI